MLKTHLLGPLNFAGYGFRGLKSYLFYGDKGNGKSMISAFLADCLFSQYYRVERRYPELPHRTLYSSVKFGRHIDEKELIHDPWRDMSQETRDSLHYPKDYVPVEDNPNGHLLYWESPLQLYDVRNGDILWDEVGKDMPAGSFADTPKQLKQVFSHLRKRGNRLFANTQIYNDIDIAFRRQIDRTFEIRKVVGSPDISASLPPVKHPWGLIITFEMDKRSLEKETKISPPKLTHQFSIPRFCFIEQGLVEYYDTSAETPPYRAMELEHLEFKCPKCGKTHVEHTKV